MNRIKELRLERKLTMTKLADMLNITNSSISNYENEMRGISIDILKLLADFFNVSIDYLLCFDHNGIYVYYENDDDSYFIINENTFKIYQKENLIYYKENRRYIDINKKLNISQNINIVEVIDFLSKESIVDLLTTNSGNLIKLKVPLNKAKSIEKIININDDKYELVEKLLSLL